MPQLFAVTGRPVAHSRSPQMMRAAFEACKLPHLYFRLAADSGEEAFQTASEIGLKGLNVTAPFKEPAFNLLDVREASLKKLSAVNTVIFEDNGSTGFNTDVHGVVKALKASGIQLEGTGILVIGAGGAARAAVAALTAECARVTVANRTLDKAAQLAKYFGTDYCGLGEAELRTALKKNAVIVSCLGLSERIMPEGLITDAHTVFDAHYASRSALAADALSARARLIDGREWLLYQGCEAFLRFTGEAAPCEAMRQAVYAPAGKRAQKIALFGFMGTGKSAVARELAALLDWPLYELDLEIERAQQRSIKEIFAEKGEPFFRTVEHECLARVCAEQGRGIIACGGGTPLRADNLRLLGEECFSIWLWTTPSTVEKRLKAEVASRPLLAGRNPHEVIYNLLKERLPLYAKAADLVISTERRDPIQVAARIKNEIDKVL